MVELLVLGGTLLVVEECFVTEVVVEVDVIGGVVEVVCVLVLVGGGVLVDFVVEVDSASLEEPNTHSAERVPTLVGAKKENNPSEQSRPPYGHPGHCWITK